MGMENFGVTVLRNLIVKILTLVSIFLFVKSYSDLYIYILILSLSLLIGNLTLFPNLGRYIGKIDFKQLRIWRHLKPSLVLFVPQIATQIYLVVNKTMLGSMTSVQSAGYFDQSDKMIKMVLAVVTATGTVMLPHVANAFMKGEVEKTKEFLYNSFSFVTAMSVPMMFGVAAVAPKFVPLFFTDKFMAVIPLMMLESVVILLIAWSNALGTQYLLPTNQNGAFTKSVIIGAVVNIVINIPFILAWGALGATLSTVLSELAVTAYQLFVVRGQIKYHSLFTDTFKYLFSGLIMFFIVFLLDNKLEDTWSMLAIEVVVGMVIYFVLLVTLRAKVIKDAISILKR